MDRSNNPMASTGWELQSDLLRGVSRTFALTIPQLPGALRNAVGNGYLLCRIADTIEDDPGIDCQAKLGLYEEFLSVLNKRADASEFSRRLSTSLSGASSPAESQLVRCTPELLALTHSLPEVQRQSLIRCVEVMSHGMYEFQTSRSLDGLESLDRMYSYCYVVAGVVGEMLTELFCDHIEPLHEHRESLLDLGVRFGLGLQMTNILKDVWEDRDAGSCWLPRDVFHERGEDLGKLIRARQFERLSNGIEDLVAVAHTNLRAALRYSYLVPRNQIGVRRFCLWAIGMALLTLQKIHRHPGYAQGDEVKISRRQVKALVLTCNSVIYSNRLVRAWFDLASVGLPLADPARACDPGRLRSLAARDTPHAVEPHVGALSAL